MTPNNNSAIKSTKMHKAEILLFKKAENLPQENGKHFFTIRFLSMKQMH